MVFNYTDKQLNELNMYTVSMMNMPREIIDLWLPKLLIRILLHLISKKPTL